MIGLMGVEPCSSKPSNYVTGDKPKFELRFLLGFCTLITPSGQRICCLPTVLACLVQRIQHWVAIRTWS